MLEVKYLYELTYGAGGSTTFKASKYIGNPVYFKCEYYSNILFEMLYDNHCLIGRSKIFKVVPMRGRI
jgi:hypothetical protein